MVTVENVSAKTLDDDSTSAPAKSNPLGSEGKSLEGADGIAKMKQTRVLETEVHMVREVLKAEYLESSGAEGGGEFKSGSLLSGLETGTKQIEIEDGGQNEIPEAMDIDSDAEVNGKTDSKETEVKDDSHGEDGSLGGNGNEPLPKTDLGQSKGSDEKTGFKENCDSLSRDGRIEEMSEGEEREDEGKDGGYGFAVGDFVWGKIKSHPWWPGMIYDPSDASEYAIKLKPADRLLVGYFGDSTFAWCYPSQLKPFEQNFQVLSKASQSKHFVKAVQDTLDVIGRLVELKVACVPEENGVELDRPLAMNAGVKEGVFVPDDGIYKFSAARYEPNRLISHLHSVAQDFSVLNMLELTVLKGYLSAFYQAKGGYQLPFYYAPQPVPGLEDNTENGQVEKHEYSYNVDTPAPGPSVDDWHSSPSQNVLQKCSETSDNKPHHKRKRKSIAEIMEGDMDVHLKEKDKHSMKSTSSSGRTKRKGNEGTDGHGGSGLSSKQKRKKTVQSENSNAGDDSRAKIDQATEQTAVENNDNPVSAKKTMIRVLSIPSDDAEDNEAGRGPPSRERRKSKYLSPPFTSPTSAQRKKDLESESLKFSSEAGLAERMTKAASSLVNGSSAILKRRSEESQMKNATEYDERPETSDSSNTKTPKQYENRVFDPVKIKASANEVLCELHSVALSPLSAIEKKTLASAWEYLSEFRNSVYFDGSDQKRQNKSQTGTKRQEKLETSFQLNFVKEKLETMASMLDELDNKNLPELKPKIEGEVKGLLERVTAMVGSLS